MSWAETAGANTTSTTETINAASAQAAIRAARRGVRGSMPLPDLMAWGSRCGFRTLVSLAPLRGDGELRDEGRLPRSRLKPLRSAIRAWSSSRASAHRSERRRTRACRTRGRNVPEKSGCPESARRRGRSSVATLRISACTRASHECTVRPRETPSPWLPSSSCLVTRASPDKIANTAPRSP